MSLGVGNKPSKQPYRLISLSKAPHQKAHRRATRTQDPNDQLFEGEVRPNAQLSIKVQQKQMLYSTI